MQNNKLIIPASIIIAGALIGGAVIYTTKAPSSTDNTNTVSTPKTVNVQPLSADDHVRGNPEAKVLAYEYSDTECPFCKVFHNTMKKIIDTYGKNSSVAWVYRPFPIVSLHPKAPKETEAMECANKLGGNDMFWKYTDKIYEITPSNNGLDAVKLPVIAADLGLDKKAFQACLDENIFTDKVQTQVNDAIAAGGQGTPYTILVPKNKLSSTATKQVKDMFAAAAAQYTMPADQLGFVTKDGNVVLNGNLPYELVQQIIAAMIS